MAGIYIHIPFCKQKCSYCDFHFSTTFGPYRQRMIDALTTEIAERSYEFDGVSLETIYFGGGTPSLLTNQELLQIFSSLREHFDISSVNEITLEANPDDITEESVSMWRAVGVNRLSIGLQSFREEDLKWMNRAHNVEEAQNAVQIAKNGGITNLTVDLIYGLPNLDEQIWMDHLKRVVSMEVQHVSAYCLTVEEKTALASMVERKKIVPASEELQSAHFDSMLNYLTEEGYEQYEISNFSKPGFESKHNTAYWQGKKYMGIGPSAHSFNGSNRRWNLSNNTIYMKGIEGEGTYFEIEELSGKDLYNERILTGLRTRKGIDPLQLEQEFGLSEEFHKLVEQYIQLGWMKSENESLILTAEGKLRADHIASELFKTEE